jgi:arsenate reductase
MIKIYHNNRCKKSRLGLELLQNSGQDYEIIHYLKTLLSEEELTDIISVLKIKPIDLVRKNESIWKSDYKSKNLSDSELISIMVKYPKLIERPIVLNKNKGVVGRPVELILDII